MNAPAETMRTRASGFIAVTAGIVTSMALVTAAVTTLEPCAACTRAAMTNGSMVMGR